MRDCVENLDIKIRHQTKNASRIVLRVRPITRRAALASELGTAAQSCRGHKISNIILWPAPFWHRTKDFSRASSSKTMFPLSAPSALAFYVLISVSTAENVDGLQPAQLFLQGKRCSLIWFQWIHGGQSSSNFFSLNVYINHINDRSLQFTYGLLFGILVRGLNYGP